MAALGAASPPKPDAPTSDAHLVGMEEELARIERAIAQAINDGDLDRARVLSEQWHRLRLLRLVRRCG
jgi:hypothetical protein